MKNIEFKAVGLKNFAGYSEEVILPFETIGKISFMDEYKTKLEESKQ